MPGGFLTGLGRASIVDVNLNEAIEREMNVLHVQPGIAAYGGFVGQYHGDGILALFPKEPDDALRGAIAMCRGLEAYNRDRGEDLPALRFGMGLHSGPVILGTIGDPDHFQCAVVVLRPLGSVIVDGRAEGMKVYECMACYPEALQGRIMANHDAYSDALAAYRAGAWAEAQKSFEVCVQGCEHDRVARGFAQRCRDRSQRGMAWDGIERPAKN